MSKLKKCLYLINLLERKGALTLKEINDYYQYSSLYEGEEIQRMAEGQASDIKESRVLW